MKEIKQSAELLNITEDCELLIERSGRICYKSEEKIYDCSRCIEPGSGIALSNPELDACHFTAQIKCPECKSRARKFIKKLIKSGHESVIEHASASFLLTTDRGITHELVRHRIAAYSQESTRYVNINGNMKVILPKEIEDNLKAFPAWFKAMHAVEDAYTEIIEAGLSPQYARSVLPNSLAAEIVVTTNFREWRHIIKERHLNTGAHPQVRELIGMVLKELKEHAPSVFEDLV